MIRRLRQWLHCLFPGHAPQNRMSDRWRTVYGCECGRKF